MKSKVVALFFLTLLSTICFADTALIPGTRHLEVSLLNQQPDPVEPGKYVEVRFNVINSGLEDAKNVVFEIEPEFPFSMNSESSASKNLGTIMGGATGNNGVTIYHRLYVSKSARQGTSNIKIRYKVDNNLWTTKTFSLRIRSDQSLLTVEEIKTNPEKISPGSECIIFLTLKNNGDDDIKNVIINLVPVQAIAQATGTTYVESVFSPYGDSTEKIIKYIEKGQSQTVEFKLIASSDAQLQPYKMPIQITYEDRMDESYSKDIYAGLVVQEDIDYVAVIEREEQIIENSKNKIYATISNKGKSKMNFVYVEVLPSEDYVILSTPGIYLGNLDSDDEDSAEYELFFNKYNQTKKVPVNVKISYRDAYNNKYTDEKQMGVLAYTLADSMKYEQKKGGSSSTTYIVILVVILLGYWLWKKKKHKKEE